MPGCACVCVFAACFLSVFAWFLFVGFSFNAFAHVRFAIEKSLVWIVKPHSCSDFVIHGFALNLAKGGGVACCRNDDAVCLILRACGRHSSLFSPLGSVQSLFICEKSNDMTARCVPMATFRCSVGFSGNCKTTRAVTFLEYVSKWQISKLRCDWTSSVKLCVCAIFFIVFCLAKWLHVVEVDTSLHVFLFLLGSYVLCKGAEQIVSCIADRCIRICCLPALLLLCEIDKCFTSPSKPTLTDRLDNFVAYFHLLYVIYGWVSWLPVSRKKIDIFLGSGHSCAVVTRRCNQTCGVQRSRPISELYGVLLLQFAGLSLPGRAWWQNTNHSPDY